MNRQLRCVVKDSLVLGGVQVRVQVQVQVRVQVRVQVQIRSVGLDPEVTGSPGRPCLGQICVPVVRAIRLCCRSRSMKGLIPGHKWAC